ncbi:MAG: YqgE/AlgH family protein [Flavobacteriaceae bacterium]|nr:YqgE/AlgH family protein [Flavobacteriaceae bacterium]
MINKGDLLIAEPNVLSDINFNRSVILIVESNQNGYVGFILNKALEYSTKQLLPDLKFNFPIYNGGPVQKENLYFIHNKPNLISESIKINNEIYWGGNFDSVLNLINNNKLKKNNIKFFLGYSGWDSFQLEDEINNSSWTINNNYSGYKKLLKSCKNIWKKNLINLGGDYLIWSNSPENPNHN